MFDKLDLCRKCDEKNFGVSELCNLEKTSTLPQPQIFGTQVLDQVSILKTALNYI